MQDGSPLGRYRLLELMGRGEMGETWRAFDTVTQRQVAVTVLPTQDVGDAVLPGDPAHAPQSGTIVEYPLYWPNGPFLADPTHETPTPQDNPTPQGPKKSRKRRLIVLSSAAAIAVTGAVVAALVLSSSGQRGDARQGSSTSASPAAPANTGPFTGTFAVHMDQAYLGGGGPDTAAEAKPWTETWQLRSACSANGCVATAAAGDHYDVSNLVFDNVGGRWVSVAISHIGCGNPNDEAWNVISLAPQPDGTLSGEATRASADGCFFRRNVTLTRKGDADISQLPDPTHLDPRAVSPAAALHGRYDAQTTYQNGHKTSVFHYGVRTDCLRTGDRCMSFFLTAKGYYEPLVFGNGAWTLNEDLDDACSTGGTYHANFTATIALPQPPQDPITSLIAHGYDKVPPTPGVNCASQAYDETYTRTGD